MTTMSVDQFSPFLTLGNPDAGYKERNHDSTPEFMPCSAGVGTDAENTTGGADVDGEISLGLDASPSKNDNNSPVGEEQSLVQEAHEIDIAKSSSICSSDSTTNLTSRGPSPSQSSASSVVADECSSKEQVADDEPACPADDMSPPPPPLSTSQEPTTCLIPDHDQMYSIFTQDHTPMLSNTIISAPARYVASTPGKKIRDKAAGALNTWLRVSDADLAQIRRVIDMLHNASLMLDDVEDGSVSRRGRPSTHMVFGTAQAINSAGYQINLAMREVMKLGAGSGCVEIFIDELDRLYIGQGYDLFWTFNIKRPSVEKYISMVDYKTGSLFNMLVRLMAAKTGVNPGPPPDLGRLVLLLGRYFQIRDDYMNLTSDEYTFQKGFCEDLDEGKFSLTLIHTLENAPEAEYSILRHVLAQRSVASTMSLAQKMLVMDIVKGAGSLEYTVAALRRIGAEIEVELGRIERETGVENGELRGLVGMLRV